MQAQEPCGPDREAARYAVLRRIGPALRHDLIVNLQALTLMTEVIVARVDRGLPPLEDLQQHLAQIQRATREAVANSLRVASWLAPPEDDRIDLRAGVHECLALVRGELAYRGFTVRAESPPAGFEVSRASLRALLLSGLLYLSDQARVAGELAVSAQTDPVHATLVMRHAPRGDAGTGASRPLLDPLEAPYRPLQARDLQALATQAGSDLHLEDGLIAFRLERLVPTTPLQIAPH